MVIFGKGGLFPFGKNFAALKSTALSQSADGISMRYASIGGAYGSAAITAVTERFGQNLKPTRTVETISFWAAAFRNGSAAVKPGFALPAHTTYGGSVVVVL